MKIGFEEDGQSPYDSGAQHARHVTETWAHQNAFCPNCGASRLVKLPNNSPVADFQCSTCQEQFELKSHKAKNANRIVDGAFGTMCERLESQQNPNLILLQYNIVANGVENLKVIPKQFFTRQIIERRKPLASTARRAGWVGCNILVGKIPEAGKIHIIKNRLIVDRTEVLEQWKKTLFLRKAGLESRGWLLEILRYVELMPRREFTIADMYAREPELQALYPENRFVREKIRQQLQVLRDQGFVEFQGGGRYVKTIASDDNYE